MKEFDPKELAEYNGENDKPVYVAYQDKVYDLSQSKLWKGGLHMQRHRAGNNLSTDIQAAPHGPELLERYPQVGILKKEALAEKKIPGILAWLMETNPFFRRHPHPMTVHFPIVFMLSNPVFNIIYLITGNKSFETTALHCLAGGILFILVAIITGLITWWYNYMGKMLKPVAVKIPLTVIMLIMALAVFIWRINDANVLEYLQGVNIIYFILVLLFIPLVSIIGWFGATMTFPLEKK